MCHLVDSSGVYWVFTLLHFSTVCVIVTHLLALEPRTNVLLSVSRDGSHWKHIQSVWKGGRNFYLLVVMSIMFDESWTKKKFQNDEWHHGQVTHLWSFSPDRIRLELHSEETTVIFSSDVIYLNADITFQVLTEWRSCELDLRRWQTHRDESSSEETNNCDTHICVMFDAHLSGLSWFCQWQFIIAHTCVLFYEL